jgi:hypothetical protein
MQEERNRERITHKRHMQRQISKRDIDKDIHREDLDACRNPRTGSILILSFYLYIGLASGSSLHILWPKFVSS